MAESAEPNHLSVIPEIKRDFLTHFQKVPDAISEDDFVPIWSILNEEVHKDILTDDFKSELQSQLEIDFQKMWDASLLENSLSIMELLKQKYRNDPKPKWRPTNQPVSIQVLPIELKTLNQKKKFLKDTIERENLEISSLMEKLDEYRKNCKHINYSQDEVLKEIEEQVTVYEEYLQRPNKFDAAALDML